MKGTFDMSALEVIVWVSVVDGNVPRTSTTAVLGLWSLSLDASASASIYV